MFFDLLPTEMSVTSMLLQPARAAQRAHHADCTLWGFLQTHKTAMFGNVLTPWGLLLRLTEFILPPPHPSVKEMYPRGGISYDQLLTPDKPVKHAR